MPDAVEVKKARRTRRCKEIIAVTMGLAPKEGDDPVSFYGVVGWPPGITRALKAIAEAKKIQTAWAKDPANASLTMQDIILMRRLATVKGKSQVIMSFCVE